MRVKLLSTYCSFLFLVNKDISFIILIDNFIDKFLYLKFHALFGG